MNPTCREWVQRPRKPEAEQRLLQAGIDPLLARLYAARGLADPDHLDQRADALDPPDSLAGMSAAVEVLTRALEQGRTVCIVGDFDCDGATSTALAVTALEAMGGRVTYVVPDRFRFGYGLTPAIVEEAAKIVAPDVLVTVDNGISSGDGIAEAQERGMEVVVTDHHLPPTSLPPADAIVNPNQPDCAFPSKAAAGVGVIFYVMAGLRARLRQADWFRRQGLEEPGLGDLLDLVAVGTVADVVPLDRNNRVLVRQGLERLRAGRARPGLRALMEMAGRDPRHIQAQDLGFVVGPRLNAAGRLEDMSLGIRCLLAEGEATARGLAEELDQLNSQRRSLEATMHDDALEGLASDPSLAERQGVCLFRRDWHPGIVGLVASRIKERLHRPVIAFAPDEDGGLKGSGRSVPGVHMRDALARLDMDEPGLVSRFGGHAMAAGLTVPHEALEAFQDAFDRAIGRIAAPEALTPRLETDGTLDPAELTLDKAELLARGGPWGTGFPPPLFRGRFRVIRQQLVGDRHLKMWLVPEGAESAEVEAIYFGAAVDGEPLAVLWIEALYHLEVNVFRNRRRLQLRIVEAVEG